MKVPSKVPSYEFIKMKVDYLYFTRTERFNPRKTSDASPRTKWVRPSHIASSKLRIFYGLRVANHDELPFILRQQSIMAASVTWHGQVSS